MSPVLILVGFPLAWFGFLLMFAKPVEFVLLFPIPFGFGVLAFAPLFWVSKNSFIHQNKNMMLIIIFYMTVLRTHKQRHF